MKLVFALMLVLFLAAAASATAQGGGAKYENFSIPGALTAPLSGSYALPGTLVQDLNDGGQVVGYYTANSSVPTRGFERNSNGKIALLDDPGAGTPISGGASTPAGTTPSAINISGVIVGSFATSVPVNEAFLLKPQGTFANFFAPAGSYYTQAFSINSAGTITGRTGILGPNYLGVTYGFILGPNGQTITFQSPSASTSGFLNGTTSLSINRSGDTTGYYYDANYIAHSYIRSADGTFTEFEVPGAGTNSYTGAWPIMIDDSGNVIGFYYDNAFTSHPYIRLADGSFTQITLPPGMNTQVFVNWVNRNGDFTGTYTDANGAFHTYVSLKNGHFLFFTDPEAGTSAMQGTVPVRINNAGQVAGYYIDANNVYHGFLWTIGD